MRGRAALIGYVRRASGRGAATARHRAARRPVSRQRRRRFLTIVMIATWCDLAARHHPRLIALCCSGAARGERSGEPVRA